MFDRNKRNVQIFLDRLNWKANTGDIHTITEFNVDVYRFRFRNFAGEPVKEFTAFLQDLCMDELRSILMIWLWLYQRSIDFRLSFGYNRRLSFRYNLQNILMPSMVNRYMRAFGYDNLMACSLEDLKENIENLKQKEGD